MAWSHLDEEFRTELAQDFESVVPPVRMCDVSHEILADLYDLAIGVHLEDVNASNPTVLQVCR